MSINDATPQDWDRVRETGEPTFEEYMKRLNSTWVYDSTRGTDPVVTADAVDFEDCWDNTPATGVNKTGLEAWMRAAHEESENVIDNVNKPTHYNTGNIECIEAIEESMSSVAFKGYLKGNCLKYLWRYDYKGKQVEDLQKAQWYLSRLTQTVVFENEENG